MTESFQQAADSCVVIPNHQSDISILVFWQKRDGFDYGFYPIIAWRCWGNGIRDAEDPVYADPVTIVEIYISGTMWCLALPSGKFLFHDDSEFDDIKLAIEYAEQVIRKAQP